MGTKQVTFNNTDEVKLYHYEADASCLGLPPGRWPRKMETDLGNGLPFVIYPRKTTPEAALYQQIGGVITLTVFND